MACSCTGCVTLPDVPACLDLPIYRGDDFNLVITIQDIDENPIDLTGRTYAAQIRATPDAAIAVSFGVSVSAPQGLVTLTLTDAQTTTNVPRVGVWDLQETITASGEITTLIAGRVTARKDVTT